MDEIFALVVSCLIEGPTSYVTGRVTKWPCREGAENAPKRMAWSSVFATGITHPHAWNLYHNMRPVYGFWLSFLVVETLVTLAEGILICWMAGLPMKRAMLASLIANTTSALAGVGISFMMTGQLG